MKSNYSFITRTAAWLLKQYIALVILSSRKEVEGLDCLLKAFKDLHEKGEKPIIMATWHNRLFLLPLITRYFPVEVSATAIISKSRDGDIPSALAESYHNVEIIRVGHKSRHSALHKMVQALHEKQVMYITPDGPKGPIYEVKPGVIFAAKKGGARVIPFTWQSNLVITCKSWDRFKIPLPFAKIKVQFREALEFPDDESLEDGCRRLEKAIQT